MGRCAITASNVEPLAPHRAVKALGPAWSEALSRWGRSRIGALWRGDTGWADTLDVDHALACVLHGPAADVLATGLRWIASELVDAAWLADRGAVVLLERVGPEYAATVREVCPAEEDATGVNWLRMRNELSELVALLERLECNDDPRAGLCAGASRLLVESPR